MIGNGGTDRERTEEKKFVDQPHDSAFDRTPEDHTHDQRRHHGAGQLELTESVAINTEDARHKRREDYE